MENSPGLFPTRYLLSQEERHENWLFRLFVLKCPDGSTSDSVLVATDLTDPARCWTFRTLCRDPASPIVDGRVEDIFGVGDDGTWLQVRVGMFWRCNLNVETGEVIDLIYDQFR